MIGHMPCTCQVSGGTFKVAGTEQIRRTHMKLEPIRRDGRHNPQGRGLEYIDYTCTR